MRVSYHGLLDELVGFEVSCTTDGEHKNDGQMVEYDFLFTSPSGAETQLTTEMCLQVGWNEWDTLKINGVEAEKIS